MSTTQRACLFVDGQKEELKGHVEALPPKDFDEAITQTRSQEKMIKICTKGRPSLLLQQDNIILLS